MKRLFLLGIAPIAIFAASSVQAREPVSCIYASLRNQINRPTLIELARNGFAAKTDKQRLVMSELDKRVDQCRDQYGWNKKRENEALKYLRNALILDSAKPALSQFGVTQSMIRSIVDGMSDDARNRFMAGRATPQIGNAIFAKLKEMGVRPDSLKQGDRGKLGVAIGESVTALIAEEQAAQEYES